MNELTKLEEALKQVFIEWLKEPTVYAGDMGICGNLEIHFQKYVYKHTKYTLLNDTGIISELIGRLLSEWKYYSGSIHYLISIPDKCPIKMYEITEDKWYVGDDSPLYDYNRMRKEAVKYLLTLVNTDAFTIKLHTIIFEGTDTDKTNSVAISNMFTNTY